MTRTGRPRGATSRKTTHQQGAWTWDGDRLASKIQQGPEEACWRWLGSRGPQGNLFGAYKRKASSEYQPQMTQANRLIYMQFKDKDCEDVSIRMRCGNKFCCNWNHFSAITPNYKQGITKEDIVIYKFSIDDEHFMAMPKTQQETIRNLAREYSQDNGIDWDWQLRWMKIKEEDLMLAELKYPGVLAQFARSTC